MLYNNTFDVRKIEKNEERKAVIRKGCELSRISTEIKACMTPEDHKRIHIAPSAKEI